MGLYLLKYNSKYGILIIGKGEKMDQEKNKNGIVILLVILVIILTAFCVLLATETISFKSNSVDNNTDNRHVTESNNPLENTNNSNDININSIDISNLDSSKLSTTENLENGYVQEITFPEIVNGNYNNYYARINLKGKVVVQGSNTSVSNGVLTNISNAVQLIHFEVPSINSDQLCYILLANGDVYYYRIGDVDDGKLTATKVDGASNVKRLFIYYHEKNTHELVAINKDNMLISLKKESV